MKILKYQKGKNNEYKIITDKEEYKLYDDIIIKYELLLRHEIREVEFNKIIQENNMLKAYYTALKIVSIKMRSEKELKELLKKKGYNFSEINYAIDKLKKEGYLKHEVYIEAYIHDMLNLYLIGEAKILNDLIKLGFKENEIMPFLNKVDNDIYIEKINKYVNKKAKVNKRSVNDFKKRILSELINKGFNKEDIVLILNDLELEENELEIEKIINKLYRKYINKFDLVTTKIKIKNYLYQKGYSNIDIDKYLDS